MRTIVWLSVSLLAACVDRFPPAATPRATVPDVQVPPSAEGRGRLVVDVVEEPAPIHRVRMQAEQLDDGQGGVRWRLFESPELLCAASPCVADLPTGNVLLGFPVLGDANAMEVDLVHVSSEPTVYRRSLTLSDRGAEGARVLGIVGATLGSLAAVTGIALLPIGLAKGDDGLALAGAISLGSGAALIGLGTWGIVASPSKYREGSSTHFPLPAAAAGGRR